MPVTFATLTQTSMWEAASPLPRKVPVTGIAWRMCLAIPTGMRLWSPTAWFAAGEAAIPQRSPSLVELLTDIVERPGWQAGNAVMFVLSGEGSRVARAFDSPAGGAPTLFVTFANPDTNQVVVNSGGGGGGSLLGPHWLLPVLLWNLWRVRRRGQGAG